MIDFKKLAMRTPEDCAADNQKRAERAMAEDYQRRQDCSKHALMIQMTDDAELSVSPSGERRISIRGRDRQQRQVRALWFVPDYYSDKAVDAIMLRSLTAGSKFQIRGYWKPKTHGNIKTFTFMAQFLEPS